MVIVKSYRGFRYNSQFLGEIEKYLSPLFDVVTPGMLARLYANPLNSIHLSVPRSIEDAYQRLQGWKHSGILIQESLPAIYGYYQHFQDEESQKLCRKGIVVMVRLDPPDAKERQIIIHERTVDEVVKKQTDLLERLLLCVAPTHGIYYDPTFTIEKLIEPYMQTPLMQAKDYQGVYNEVSVIQDYEVIRAIQEHLSDKKIFLADGHHRLKSAETLQAKYWDKIQHQDHHPFRYHFIYLTNGSAPDLQILPIHRLFYLKDGWDKEQFINALQRYFYIQKPSGRQAIEQELVQKQAIAAITDRNTYLLRLKPEAQEQLSRLPFPTPLKELPYFHLHYFAFEQIAGIPYEKQTRSEQIHYVKEKDTFYQCIQTQHCIGFLMRSLSIEQMIAVCQTGFLMPPKSTFFYPKVTTGFVFASIDPEDYQQPTDRCFGLCV